MRSGCSSTHQFEDTQEGIDRSGAAGPRQVWGLIGPFGGEWNPLAWFESRPIHPVNRTTIRNQARRLTRSYSQSGVAHAPKLKPGFGARLMNNFGVTIRTRTRTRTRTICLTNFGIQDKIAQNRKRRARCGPGSLELVPGGAARLSSPKSSPHRANV